MSTFGELRTVDISEYKSDSLRVMQDSLNRYLGKKKYGQSKMNDDEFQKSRELLEGKDRPYESERMCYFIEEKSYFNLL